MRYFTCSKRGRPRGKYLSRPLSSGWAQLARRRAMPRLRQHSLPGRPVWRNLPNLNEHVLRWQAKGSRLFASFLFSPGLRLRIFQLRLIVSAATPASQVAARLGRSAYKPRTTSGRKSFKAVLGDSFPARRPGRTHYELGPCPTSVRDRRLVYIMSRKANHRSHLRLHVTREMHAPGAY